jgi:uncharacterized protein (DUF1800 family)
MSVTMKLERESIEDAAGSDAEDGGEQPSSRRAFFFLGALAAVGLRPSRAHAQRTARKPVPRGRFQTVAQSEVPGAPAAWQDKITRLLRRATYGPIAADLTLARGVGYQAWLQRQLKHTRIPNGAVDALVAQRYPNLALTVDDIYAISAGTLEAELQQATIFRAAFSERQLYERMVEFWSDHFNIDFAKVGYLKLIDDRDVIRKYALGRFGDLVKASAKSPAMLAYLDQTQSRVGRPNQNYARELMELHTLGVDGGYTQEDVAELSRVLTGWTIKGRGNFAFDPTLHDWGAKTVMGMTIPAGSSALGQEGIKEGERVLDMLLAHPSTAKFIATKMLRWLLTSEPTDSQIRTVSSVYRATGGDIGSMVRAILNDSWLGGAPARYKRPFHFLVSGLRALSPTVTSTDPVNRQLATLGQTLFEWDTPDGYPDRIEYWAGNITTRWQFGNTLANYKAATIAVDHAPYLAAGADGAIEMINKNVFAGEISPSTRTALRTYIGAGTLNETRVRETIGLAIASSDFQWY